MFNLGVLGENLGHVEEARAWYAKAINSGPPNRKKVPNDGGLRLHAIQLSRCRPI